MNLKDIIKGVPRMFETVTLRLKNVDPGGVNAPLSLQFYDVDSTHDSIGVTVSGSTQVTLPKGKYVFMACTGGIRSGWGILSLYNVTQGATIEGSIDCSSYHNPNGGTFEDLKGMPGVIAAFTEETVIEWRAYFQNDPTGMSHVSPVLYTAGTLTIIRYSE